VLAALGLGGALLLLLFNWAAASLVCSQDTSYCAESTEKDGIYRGELINSDGSPAANREFTVSFQSREYEPDLAFTTDANGAFCIRWAQESITPHVQEADLLIADPSSEYPDSRITDFKESTAGPPDCQSSDARIPWHNAENLKSSWQYVLMMGLAAGAALLFLLALLRAREPSSATVARIGGALLGGAILATVLGWTIL
jgi:hypothetical protein